jgi:hypothetical protein
MQPSRSEYERFLDEVRYAYHNKMDSMAKRQFADAIDGPTRINRDDFLNADAIELLRQHTDLMHIEDRQDNRKRVELTREPDPEKRQLSYGWRITDMDSRQILAEGRDLSKMGASDALSAARSLHNARPNLGRPVLAPPSPMRQTPYQEREIPGTKDHRQSNDPGQQDKKPDPWEIMRMDSQTPARDTAQQQWDEQTRKLEAWWQKASELDAPPGLVWDGEQKLSDLSVEDRRALTVAADIHGDCFRIEDEQHLDYRITYKAIPDPAAERVDLLWSLHGPQVGDGEQVKHAHGLASDTRSMTADARLALTSQIQFADEASVYGAYFDYGGLSPEVEAEDGRRRFIPLGSDHIADIRRVATIEPLDGGEFGAGREHKEHFVWSVHKRGHPAHELVVQGTEDHLDRALDAIDRLDLGDRKDQPPLPAHVQEIATAFDRKPDQVIELREDELPDFGEDETKPAKPRGLYKPEQQKARSDRSETTRDSGEREPRGVYKPDSKRSGADREPSIQEHDRGTHPFGIDRDGRGIER